MSDKSKIEWTDATWQPVVGCSKCSLGCLNCYAEKMAIRLSAMGQEKYQRVVTAKAHSPGGKQKWHGTIYCDEKVLDKPLHWRKPRRIFVCSMSDLFHEKVSFEFINKIALIMARCPQHTFQVLTKRPKIALEHTKNWQKQSGYPSLFGNNVWLGVSISTQAEADEKIPILLQIPAAIKWISIEPILEAVDFGLTGARTGICNWSHNKHRIDWVVIGAESIGGRPGRECKLEWVRDLVGQCKAAGVPAFVKQIHLNGKLVKNIKDFPKDLQIREYPKGAAK